MKCCGDCEHAVSIPQDLKVISCFGAPPQIVVIPTPQGLQIQLHRPALPRTERACALFKEKVPFAFTDAEIQE